MSARLASRVEAFPVHAGVGALCVGIAAANVGRAGAVVLPAAVVTGAVALCLAERRHLIACALALALAGWWWGSARLTAIDRSVLAGDVGRAGRTELVIVAPARRGRFDLRVAAQVRAFGSTRVHENVLLELPLGRAPPQGAVIQTLAEIRQPRGPSHGYDERTWLRRHGIHVVLRGERWRVVGRRGGLSGVVDLLRARVARSIGRGLRGDRRGVVQGVVLGDDGALSNRVRDAFRASGLYHLLAVSGQNVAIVAGGVLVLAWLAGFPRWLGHVGALAAIGAYVLAVGAQPSVVRAGIAGALGSLAWLVARAPDRWHFLLLGALALLAANPYSALDPGFQLSFAAVGAIFVLVPRFERALEGYPVPRGLALTVAVSTACGLVTAPILWFQFGAVPLLSVPANVAAAPAVPPLLGLGLASAALDPIAPSVASSLASLNGLCAAYLVACADVVAALPLAQVKSTSGIAALASGAAGVAAYACARWRT